LGVILKISIIIYALAISHIADIQIMLLTYKSCCWLSADTLCFSFCWRVRPKRFALVEFSLQECHI